MKILKLIFAVVSELRYLIFSPIGLEHIIPMLTEQGITTPKKLAQLSLRDMYEIGISHICILQPIISYCIRKF